MRRWRARGTGAPAKPVESVPGGPAAIVHLERAVPGGDVIGRWHDGQWLFASGAVPGDTIRVTELLRRRGVARAEGWVLEVPSRDRRTAPCPIAELCGGCDWMAFDPSAQRTHKLALVKDALRRVGGISELPNEVELVTVGDETGYRSRARLHVTMTGELGFLARKSHRVVELANCLVCSPRLNAALRRLRAAFQHGALGALAARTFAQVELRTLAARDEAHLSLRDRTAGVPSALTPWLEALGDDFVVAVDTPHWDTPQAQSVSPFTADDARRLGAALSPTPDVARLERLLSLEVSVAPGMFTQVNWAINSRNITELLIGAHRRRSLRFLDLYSGNGNLSLPLLALGLSGIGVEQNERSVRCALDAVARLGLGGRFEASPVSVAATELLRRRESFDLVVLDPARAGAGEDLPAIAKLASSDLFYCACDPVSLARDVRWLTANGFELLQVTAYDMFPQTHHVETTAWLRRVTRQSE